MRHLSLFPLTSPLESVAAAQNGPGCTLCTLGNGRPGINSGVSAEGQSFGWLVVADAPSVADNTSGIPLSGNVGVRIRQEIRRAFEQEPFAFATAVGCATTEVEDEHVRACAPHFKHGYEQVQPRGIFVLGAAAALQVLGYRVTMDSVEGGYGFIPDAMGLPIPVVILPAMHHLARNRLKMKQALAIMRRWVDMRGQYHALTRHLGSSCIIVESGADAEFVANAIDMEALESTVSVDVETWYPAFRGQRIVSIALSWKTPTGTLRSAVWDKKGLADLDAIEALQGILGNDRILKVLHNGKFDEHAFYSDKR
jgi:uracil-DNA glycosylase